MRKIGFIVLVLGIILVSSASAFALVTPPIRGNAGATNNYVDTAGNTWTPIPVYSAGGWGRASSSYAGGATSAAIANTDDDPLFQKYYYYGSAMEYKFDLADGSYNVNLLFAEVYHTAAGNRIFDVAIEGATVLDDFDIFADAGGKNIATIKTIPVTVHDEQLNIVFTGIGPDKNAVINGIAVTPIPEPATLLLLGGGLGGILAFGRRNRKK